MKTLTICIETVTSIRLRALAAKHGIPSEVAASAIVDAVMRDMDAQNLPEVLTNAVTEQQPLLC